MTPKDREPRIEPLTQPLQALLTSVHTRIWGGVPAGQTQVAIAVDSVDSLPPDTVDQGVAVVSPVRGHLTLISFQTDTKLSVDDLYAFAQIVVQPNGLTGGPMSLVQIMDRHLRNSPHADGNWANNMGVGQAIADVTTNDEALPQMEVTLKGNKWQITSVRGKRQEILDALCEPPTVAGNSRINPRLLNAFTIFDLSDLNIPWPSNS